jgi:hypothetical protein
MIKRFYAIYNSDNVLVQKIETFGNPTNALPDGFSAVEVDDLESIEFPVVESAVPSQDVIAREQRDLLLQQSDWTQVPDAPVNSASWATYRQALRDVPSQSGFPDNITWPTKPTD